MSEQGPGPGSGALDALAALQNSPAFASNPFASSPAAPPGYPAFDPGPSLPPIGAPPPVSGGGFGPHPPAPSNKPTQLEDLYAYYPDIGDGAYRIRVERIWPKSMNGQVVAGILGDLDEKLSYEEFKQRFGGNRYKVSVIGPDPRQRSNPTAAAIVRTLMTVQFDIPGPPRMDGYGPQTSEEDPMQRGPMNMGMGWGGMAPQVEVARITADNDWRRQAEQERANLTRMAIEAERARGEIPSAVMETMREQYRMSIEKIESAARESLAAKDIQVQEANDRARRAEQDLGGMRETLLREQMNYANQRKGLEAEERERIVSDYREQLNRAQTEYRMQMERAEERFRGELQVMSQRLADTTERLQRDFNAEKERIVNDARYREDRAKADSDRDRQQLREAYDARLSDIQRSFERDVTMLREQQAREIAAIRSQWETTANLSEKTAQMKVDNNDSEMRRKEEEIRRLREELSDVKKLAQAKDREMEQMRRDAVKAPLEAIKESKDLLEAIGMEVVPAGSSGSGEEEVSEGEEGKEKGAGWQSVLQEGLKMAIAAGPDLIKAAVGGNGQPADPAQQQALAQQQAMAAQQQALVTQQQAAMQRTMSPQGPIAPPPPPARRPAPPPAQAQAPSPAQAATPTTPQPAARARGSRGATAQAQPQQPVAQQPAQVSDETRAIVEGGGIDQLVQRLDQAITLGFPADAFAAEFIKTVGPKSADEITRAIKADTLIGLIAQAVKQGAPGAKCLTNDGKKYVRSVFAAIGQQVAGAPVSVAGASAGAMPMPEPASAPAPAQGAPIVTPPPAAESAKADEPAPSGT